MKRVTGLFLACFIIPVLCLAQLSKPDLKEGTGTGILYNDNTNFIAINEVFMWIGNNSMDSHNPITDGPGYFWPGGRQAVDEVDEIPAIFADGLVWGGKVDGEVNVNGSTYRFGLQAGKILEDGTAADPFLERYRVFKIREDWESLPPGPERDQYEQDYNEWPVEDGAPWTDVDGNGIYTSGIDKPEFTGDETLWYVANDLDPARTTFTYGSLPIGLEFQTTVYAFERSNYLGDAVFKKYRVINKSDNTVDSMYLAYWSDVDLGFAADDYAGCDTLRNLSYTYNGDNNDEGYYELNPPAVGHLLLQGPIVPATTQDSAFFNNQWQKGFIKLPMTTFAFYINSNPIYQDPDLGTGAVQFYNYMKGRLWDGSAYIDPNTGIETMYPLAGNPVNGTGWYEGDGWPAGPEPGDRRTLLSSGPCTMTPGDTQEIVISIFVARGDDNINSITKLKHRAELLQDFYYSGSITSVTNYADQVPEKFELYQNYPNPFNPSTIIQYHLKEEVFVSLKIFNLIGEEVATLVNEKQTAGSYVIDFYAEGLTSGVYLFQLNTGTFTDTKKMIFLR